MVTVVIVKNAFDPANGREVHKIKYQKNASASEYSKSFINIFSETEPVEGDDYTIAVNSYVKPGNTIIQDGDFIVLSPVVAKGGGKNPFVIVAAIALSVVSMGIGANVAGLGFTGSLAHAVGWASIGGYLAAAVTMYVGGIFIQRAFGTVADTNDATTTNPTYNWGDITTTTGQNNPIPIFYGTAKTGGQTIGKYLTSVDDKQYLNWLLAVGEGPLNISDIRINDNPIASYDNVQVEIRQGTYDQDPISNFNDTVSTKELGYEIIENQYRKDIVSGNANEGIIVYAECSNGLYYANDDGGLDEAWVRIAIEYALIGTDNWKRMGEYTITGNKSSAVRRQFRIDNIPQGEYNVRVIVTGRSSPITSTRASTRIWWTAVAGIVYDDFCYPGIALVGIKALATDQLSGSPTVTLLATRGEVYVFNPTTNTYEIHDATNPAWAAYDFIHQCHYIKNVATGNMEYLVKGGKAEIMLYDKFLDWAGFCDTFNLKINIQINSIDEMLTLCNAFIGPVGRGKVDLFGTKYGPVWDGPKDPVQMFGNGNIIAGTFQRTFVKTKDRANAVEITYTNKQKNYDRDTLMVYSDHYDTDEYDKKGQLTYNGIIDPEQAYREGKFQLYCNELMDNGAKWTSDIQAIACNVGDVVYVASDIPKWGCSGHIIGVSGNAVTINRVFEEYDSTKQYRFAFRCSKTDIRYEVDINYMEVLGDSTIIYLVTAPDEAPSVDDIFDIAEKTIGTKLMTIKSITRAQDFTRQIEGVNYDPGIFEENYDIPDIDYSTAQKNEAVNVTKLTGNQQLWTAANGIKQSRMYLSWQMPTGYGYTRFSVFLSTDKGLTWIPAGSTTNQSIEIDTAYGTEYYVKVITIYGVSQSDGATTYVDAGVDDMPPDVTTLTCELMATGTRRYWWNFVYPDINDIAGFRMKYTQGQSLNWDAGIPIQDGLITTQPYETQTVRQGMHAVMIKAVDNAGNESLNFAYCILDLGDLLEQNVLWTKDFSENQWADVTHTGYVNTFMNQIEALSDTYMWPSPTKFMWTKPTDYMWRAVWKQYTVLAEITAPASGQFWLQYDIDGPAIVYYRKKTTTSMWSGDDNDSMWKNDDSNLMWEAEDLWRQWSDRVMITAGDVIEIKIEALNSSQEKTIIKGLKAIIDVPDVTEHFENITIPEDGLTLPIKTPNYYTIAVRIDAIQGTINNASEMPTQAQIIERNPCVIKLLNSSGINVAGTIDATWQGFQKEAI